MRVKDLPPLLQACALGDLEKVQDLLQSGEAVNQLHIDGNNAIWLASYSDNPAIIEYLVAQGADVNNQNGDGVTALVYAASAGKADVVRCLLEQGADPSLETVDGYTALDLSATRHVMNLLRQPTTAARSI